MVGNDKDELANELEEMLAMEQMDDVDVGMGHIEQNKVASKVQPA